MAMLNSIECLIAGSIQLHFWTSAMFPSLPLRHTDPHRYPQLRLLALLHPSGRLLQILSVRPALPLQYLSRQTPEKSQYTFVDAEVHLLLLFYVHTLLLYSSTLGTE